MPLITVSGRVELRCLNYHGPVDENKTTMERSDRSWGVQVALVFRCKTCGYIEMYDATLIEPAAWSPG